MLVLSRKHRESVVVGGTDHFENILKVTILGIRHGRVRLGFEANGDVPVHREEVWERMSRRPGDQETFLELQG
jgi:carbon storage regulator CsrA